MVSAVDGAQLSMRGVSMAYTAPRDTVRILDGAQLRLQAGAQVAIRGPSGCGKSTLLHLLAGIEPAATGVIRWDDAPMHAMSRRERERWRRTNLGMVFQQFHLFSGLDAVSNVLLPVTFTRAPGAEDRRRAADLLAQVGVACDRAVETLSRGEQQRVAVARALARGPRIVLADEPTASLDAASAAIVADLLRGLCRRSGATLVVATHDDDLASRLDATYRLRGGKLERDVKSSDGMRHAAAA